MEIAFRKVVPLPLAHLAFSEESIWQSDFIIKSTEKTLLNASSGKGKTTFTHLLAGLRKDFSGEVLINGTSLLSYSLNDWTDLRKDKISYVFQDLRLFGDLTVEENLKLKNDLTEHLKEEDIRDMLAQLGLEEKWKTKVDLLSMGQQQRIAILRALCQPFEILIMDEPFSHLDEENAKLCLNLIIEHSERQKAGFLITSLGSHHDIDYQNYLNL